MPKTRRVDSVHFIKCGCRSKSFRVNTGTNTEEVVYTSLECPECGRTYRLIGKTLIASCEFCNTTMHDGRKCHKMKGIENPMIHRRNRI